MLKKIVWEYCTLEIENNSTYTDDGRMGDLKTVSITDTAVANDEANDLGRDGWEMFTIHDGVAWFKRSYETSL